MTFILVDCEGHGPAAGLNDDVRFEFGAVELKTRNWFHGKGGTRVTFESFAAWLSTWEQPLVFVSDNPAYDWQFINYYFHKFMGKNPFGHSARRIGDFYAGLMRNILASGRDWKRLRRTPHDHDPVHDAMGNAEAFDALIRLAADYTRTGACAMGLLCPDHGFVHGAEAEELRERLEAVVRLGKDAASEPDDVERWAERILGEVDARDSLAFREMKRQLLREGDDD